VVALSLFVLAICGRDNEQITFSAAFLIFFFFAFPKKMKKNKKRKAGSISQVQILKKKEPKQLLKFLFFAVLKKSFTKFYFFGSLT